MPIVGLSDKRRWSRAGKIRIGEKAVSKGGKEYPKKLDHFIFDPVDPNMLPTLQAQYGERPQELTVCLPAEDPDLVFAQWYKCYNSNGLLCKGDGCIASRAHEGELIDVECAGPENCDFSMARGMHGKPGCKQLASLQVFLPDLPGFQIWQIDTTSFNSIVNINTSLDVMRRVLGRIAMMEVKLVVRPQQAHNPEDGKKITIFVLDLIVPHSIRDAGMVRQLGVGAGPAELPPPPQESYAPDGLYAKSQITHDAVAVVETVDEDGVITEAEVVDDTADLFGEEPEPLTLDRDPDVLEALKQLPAMHRGTMLTHAMEKGWTKDHTLRAIEAGVAKLAREAAPAPEPEPEPIPEEIPVNAEGEFF